MIDYEKGVVADLCPPKWSDPFNEVISSKKAEPHARLFQMAWISVLNHEEDSSSLPRSLNRIPLFHSLFCVQETLPKLLVNCKFSTQLVSLINKSSPTMDFYAFVPQLVNSTEISKATVQSEYERNESIMG